MEVENSTIEFTQKCGSSDCKKNVRRAAAMQLGTGLPSCSVRGGVALLPESTLFCGAEREVGPEELEL